MRFTQKMAAGRNAIPVAKKCHRKDQIAISFAQVAKIKPAKTTIKSRLETARVHLMAVFFIQKEELLKK